jgi:predicted component of type VI protein secretion system
MDYQLHVVRGRSVAQSIPLRDGITTVGRQSGCELRVGSSQVSRKHCQLFEQKGKLVVKDLGSANGTYVNGDRVEEMRVLDEGDELTIGSVKFRVERLTGRPGTKAGDTAVRPAPVAGADEGFAIELDDDGETAAAAPAAKAAEPAAQTDETDVASVPAMADEDVADFLLGIDLDEEDKR